VLDFKIQAQIERAVKVLDLSGIVNIELAYPNEDNTGTPCIYEINPRPSAALAFSEQANVPMLADYLQLTAGHEVASKRPELLFMQRSWKDNFANSGALDARLS